MSKNFIELRIYSVYPDKLNTLMDLWEQNYKYIQKYFNCSGVFLAKNGNINKVYHTYIWKSYDEMETQKNKFKEDKKMKIYIRKVKKTYLKQESIFLEEAEFYRKNNK